MSKPFQIKEPQQALTAYLQELLLDNEPTALPLTPPALEEVPATETVETSPPIETTPRPVQDSQALLFDIAGLSLVLPLTNKRTDTIAGTTGSCLRYAEQPTATYSRDRSDDVDYQPIK